MAYNPNIPLATDVIKVSQSNIVQNFTQIQTLIDVNHGDFGTPNEGQHLFVTLPNNNAVPLPADDSLNVYANNYAPTNQSELFVIRQDAVTWPITASSQTARGYTYLPSGLILQWGNATINSNAGAFTFVWPTAGNFFAFTTQFWGNVFIGADPANNAKDVNAVAYVTDLTNPTQISYRVWRRNLFNTQGTNQAPFSVWAVAIGV
jgi:hypothetical protein